MTRSSLLEPLEAAWDQTLAREGPAATLTERGVVESAMEGVVEVRGLPGAQNDELLLIEVTGSGGRGLLPGLVFNLDPDRIGVVVLGEHSHVEAGDEVRRTGRVLDVPVGTSLLGRVLNPLGEPLDSQGPVRFSGRLPVERPAPAILDRSPVSRPLQTGVKVVDALVPIGRGQRELLVGDRQTGKTAVALDAIINQANQGVICIYCAIAQRSASNARIIADLRRRGAMTYTIVVAAAGDDSPGLQFIAPYAATAMGEYFMERGQDVLIVYDDLSSHARAYRELSLLLRRPPGREAFPGDIFYIHSRLLERSTQLRAERGGGSMTALPIVATEGQNISAYIPTNLISITDGQVYLSPQLFRKGVLPAVDVGKSVSRVGGQSQLPAYRKAVKSLRLAYSQFEELEMFARFGTRLDESTQRALAHGRRVRALLTQSQYDPVPVAEQIAIMVAAAAHTFDELPLGSITKVEQAFRTAVRTELGEVFHRLRETGELTDQDKKAIITMAERVARSFSLTDSETPVERTARQQPNDLPGQEG